MIHPTAIVHSAARIGEGTQVGPYCVVDGDVILGDQCQLGPHVYLTGHTRIGSRNQIHAGCVIGDLPQDVRFAGGPTGVTIGDANVIREHVTIHRSNKVDEPTRIGSHNLLMAHCHVGHNTVVGNNVIIANGALLAGHVVVEDRVFISGNCLVHQFVRVGTLALMQGGSAISKDLPPFTIARGDNGIAGLNTVGLRRAGITGAERLELRRAYHLLFRSGLKMSEALSRAQNEFKSARSKALLDFVASARRGVCADRSPSSDVEEDSEETTA
jgi:UDP-N-acetylglucosamine acyltransferase